jgi:hypothetical protein
MERHRNMMRFTAYLMTLIAAVAAQGAYAACDYPAEVTIPDGNTATEAQMREANQVVRKYMADVDAYLACLDEEEKALGEAVTEEQKGLHISRHNAAVDALNAVAARYNEQVQLFKKRAK